MTLKLETIEYLYILMAGLGSVFGWSTSFVHGFSTLYIGYGPSSLGSVIGALWEF